MAYSQAELDALKTAFASGTLEVTFEGKRVKYGDAADLLTRIRAIESEINAGANRPLPVAGKARFRRG